jgi:hypothetical protein
MEKIHNLLTRLVSMGPGILGLIIIALFAAGYHRLAFMIIVLGSLIGMLTLLVVVVLLAIREKPIPVPKQKQIRHPDSEQEYLTDRRVLTPHA